MPLSKARNRQRMRDFRAKSVQLEVQPKPLDCVQPIETSKPTKQEFRFMIHNMEARIKPIEPKEEFIPWYNPQRHKTGDKVRIYNASGEMQIVIVPELDAEGQPIGE